MSKHKVLPYLIRPARSVLNLMLRAQNPNPSRILLLETFGVKDTISAIPAIESLYESFPGVVITVATTPASCELLKSDNRVSKTIPVAAPWVFAKTNRWALLHRRRSLYTSTTSNRQGVS